METEKVIKNGNTGDLTEEGTPIEDVYLAIDLVSEALEKRPLIREAIIGEKYLNLSKEARGRENLTQRFTFFFADEDRKVPGLFFRFVGDESPLVEMFFYPYESVLLFIDEARNIVANNFIDRDEKAKTDLVFDFSLEMTLLLFDSFYRRAELAMEYFSLEVIGQWHRNKHLEIFQTQSEQGKQVKKFKHPFLDTLLNDYRKELSQFWKFQGRSYEDFRKAGLAEEYESILKHWKLLLKASSDDTVDWRDYSNAGRFKDTPEDLLRNLLDVDRSSDESSNTRISEIALEHAARRVGLIKRTGVSEYARNKRKEGIKISDYSSTQLFAFLQEGRTILANVAENKKALAQMENQQSFEQISDSALEKKRKSLEQKINFAKRKLDDQLEQKAISAQGKNF